MRDWEINWVQFLTHALKLAGAFVLALPIGWEREHQTRIVGLRTFPLVAVASCGYVLIAVAVVGVNEEAQARIIQGLVTGIGFIGGGAILKERATVRGTATAASVWMMGAVGASVAYGRYGIALLLSLITYLTLQLLTPAARNVEKGG